MNLKCCTCTCIWRHLVNAEYLPNFEVCVSVGNFEPCSCWASDVLTFGKLMVTTVWQTVLGQ